MKYDIKQFYLGLALCLCFSSTALAQGWMKVYEFDVPSRPSALFQTANNEYQIALMDYQSGVDNAHLSIYRINEQGDTLWTQKYPDILLGDVYQMIQTNDNGALVYGSTYIDDDFFDIQAIKLDPNGVVEWQTAIPNIGCLLYTSPSPRDGATSRMPSSA